MLYSSLLFVLSSVYTAYLAHSGAISDTAWLSLLFVLIIFSALFSANQSFTYESGRGYLSLYPLASPLELFLSKLLFQLIFQGILAVVSLMVMLFLFGIEPEHWWSFVLVILSSSLAFSGLLTSMAGLAAKAGKNQSLLTILALPLLYPIVSLSVNAGKMALSAPFLPGVFDQILVLILLVFALSSALGLLLFPYIWRD